MSLKRKASFSGIASPNSDRYISDSFMAIDDSPRHLNSRTRKRYRNDRPEDAVVYENTLRWLFTAQQQPQAPPTPSYHENDDGDMNPEPVPTPETVDPRQQTLYKFFRPAAQSSFGQSPSGRWNQQSDDVLPGNGHIGLPGHDVNMNVGSDANSACAQGANTDMDVEMDSGSDGSGAQGGKWAGELRWM